MTAEDRVALILGRAIIRAEALQTQLEEAQAQLRDHQTPKAPRKRNAKPAA